jgi:hypothetical protein
MDSYKALMDEVKVINAAYKWVGVLDALVFIKENEDEYKGSPIYRELQLFMQEGSRLFAPKN